MEGYVLCKCFEKGVSDPHPNRRLLLEPMPGVLVLSAKASEDDRGAHDDWLAEACRHSLMQTEYRFIYGLDAGPLIEHVFGPDGPGAGYPELAALILCRDDPPPTPPGEAREIADQIKAFLDSNQSFSVTEVVDRDTGRTIAEGAGQVVHTYMGDRGRLEFGPAGVSLVRDEKTVFETPRLKQEEQRDGTYRLIPGSGDPATASAAFLPYDAENPEKPETLPREVETRSRREPVSSLSRFLDPVVELLEEAIRSGHCVVWAGNEDLGH